MGLVMVLGSCKARRENESTVLANLDVLSQSQCAQPHAVDSTLSADQTESMVKTAGSRFRNRRPVQLPSVGSLANTLIRKGIRSIDGSRNNGGKGARHRPFRRLVGKAYQGGGNGPRIKGSTGFLPNAQLLSKLILGADSNKDRTIDGDDRLNAKGASDWLWQWGQFVDHDLDLAEPTPGSPEFNIPGVRTPNPLTGRPVNWAALGFRRTHNINGEHPNDITHYLDGSNVYGSEPARCRALRSMTMVQPLKEVNDKADPRGLLVALAKSEAIPQRRNGIRSNHPEIARLNPQDLFRVVSLGRLVPNGKLMVNTGFGSGGNGKPEVNMMPQNFRFGDEREVDPVTNQQVPGYGGNARGPISILPNSQFFLAGDIRANEQFWLTAVHTLFFLEHNTIAHSILAAFRNSPQFNGLSDEVRGNLIFEMARAVVIAEIQAITYREFLPLLLGRGTVNRTIDRFNPAIDPRISNAFATAAYRAGHSLVSGTVDREPLFCGFFNPLIIRRGGLNEALIRLGNNPARAMDARFNSPFVVSLFPRAQRNTCRGGEPVAAAMSVKPGSPGTQQNLGQRGIRSADLGAFNIQRGRDHGIPSYVQTYNRLTQIKDPRNGKPLIAGKPVTNEAEVLANFREEDVALYKRINAEFKNKKLPAYPVQDIDLFIGGLMEKPLVRGDDDDIRSNSMLGPTFTAIIKEQFDALRDGDQMFYTHYLPKAWVKWVNQQSLTTIIKRNLAGRPAIGADAMCAGKRNSQIDRNGDPHGACIFQ